MSGPGGADPAAIGVFIGFGVFYLALLVAVAWAYVNIVRRAGYSGWWVLIGLVPIVNVVMFMIFAFKEWPVQRELATLRAIASHHGYAPGPDGSFGSLGAYGQTGAYGQGVPTPGPGQGYGPPTGPGYAAPTGPGYAAPAGPGYGPPTGTPGSGFNAPGTPGSGFNAPGAPGTGYGSGEGPRPSSGS